MAAPWRVSGNRKTGSSVASAKASNVMYRGGEAAEERRRSWRRGPQAMAIMYQRGVSAYGVINGGENNQRSDSQIAVNNGNRFESIWRHLNNLAAS